MPLSVLLVNHRHGVLQVEPCVVRLRHLLHPVVQFCFGFFEDAIDVGDRAEMTKEQPGGRGLVHSVQARQCQVKVEIRRRCCRSDLLGIRHENPGSIARVEVTGLRINEGHVVRRVSRVVKGLQATTVTEVDLSGVAQCDQTLRGCGDQRTEEPVHVGAEDPHGACHEFGGVGQMARTTLVHNDLGLGEGGGDVTHSTGMVQMDMRHHYRREIVGTHS